MAALKDWYTGALTDAMVTPMGGTIRDADIDGLARILNEFLPQYASIGADQAARSVATGEAFEVVSHLPANYSVQLARDLSESAQGALTTTIREGIEQGMSVAEVQVEIERAVPDIAGFSAERVARTESAQAIGLGKVEQWDSMGIKGKKWQLAVAACPLCEAFYASKGSKTTPMTEPFVRAGETIAYVDEDGKPKTYTAWRDVFAPPLHPNDRCDVLAVLEDDE